jgi:hypothetical protein
MTPTKSPLVNYSRQFVRLRDDAPVRDTFSGNLGGSRTDKLAIWLNDASASDVCFMPASTNDPHNAPRAAQSLFKGYSHLL